MEEKTQSGQSQSYPFRAILLRRRNGENRWDITTVKDISESGVSIQTGRFFETGSKISLRFKIPSRPFEMTEVTGKVVGCVNASQSTTYHTRIEFSNLSEDIKIIFHEYVNWVVKKGTQVKRCKMSYDGPERRKNPRIKGRFIVSYRIMDEGDNIDITQTKNIGLGGMLLTTNRNSSGGTPLAVEIRLPFETDPIMVIGKVIDSLEITKDLIYDTRLEFIAIDENHRSIINKTVDYYVNKR